jgi:hypothetical protein
LSVSGPEAWKRQCAATSKRTGVRCKRWAIAGGRTCSMHGSATKAARANAARVMQTHLASSYALQLGGSLEVEPLEALLSALWQSAGQVAFYRALVGELAPAVGGAVVDVVDEVDSSESDPRDSEESRPVRREWREGVAGPDHLGDARAHIFVQQYDAALERMAKIAKMCLEAGVEERQVRLAEEQGHIVADVIRAVLTDMGIRLDDPRALDSVRRHLDIAVRRYEAIEVRP